MPVGPKIANLTVISGPTTIHFGLIGPPFIEIPPRRYGGTELFIGNLACDLYERGLDVTVYGNGESRLPCNVKWRYEHSEWPLAESSVSCLKNVDHSGWAVHDAAQSVDLLHLNDIAAIPFTSYVDLPAVLTIHHPHEPMLSNSTSAIRTCTTLRSPAGRAPGTDAEHSCCSSGIPVDRYTFSSAKRLRLFSDEWRRARVRTSRSQRLVVPGFPSARWRNPADVSGVLGARREASIDGKDVEYVGRRFPVQERTALARGLSCSRFNGKSRSAW